MIEIPNISKVAEMIGIPVDQWPGKCHQIADALMSQCGPDEGGHTCYGHWHGPVEPGTLFAGRPVVQHGWGEYSDDEEGRIIIDPTRWVFENAKPYIFHAPDFDQYYDVGGNSFREMMHPEPPEFDLSGKTFEFPDGDIEDFCIDRLGVHNLRISDKQCHYLAVTPLTALLRADKGIATGMYSWLVERNMQAYIPLDNRLYIEHMATSNG